MNVSRGGLPSILDCSQAQMASFTLNAGTGVDNELWMIPGGGPITGKHWLILRAELWYNGNSGSGIIPGLHGIHLLNTQNYPAVYINPTGVINSPLSYQFLMNFGAIRVDQFQNQVIGTGGKAVQNVDAGPYLVVPSGCGIAGVIAPTGGSSNWVAALNFIYLQRDNGNC